MSRRARRPYLSGHARHVRVARLRSLRLSDRPETGGSCILSWKKLRESERRLALCRWLGIDGDTDDTPSRHWLFDSVAAYLYSFEASLQFLKGRVQTPGRGAALRPLACATAAARCARAGASYLTPPGSAHRLRSNHSAHHGCGRPAQRGRRFRGQSRKSALEAPWPHARRSHSP